MNFKPQNFLTDGDCPYCESAAVYSEDAYDVEFVNDGYEIVMRFECRNCKCKFEVFYEFKSLKTDKGEEYTNKSSV